MDLAPLDRGVAPPLAAAPPLSLRAFIYIATLVFGCQVHKVSLSIPIAYTTVVSIFS